tara:strand:- start:115 stop:345 length:231 start_codon:yes stop_codon:yes gene_type:complete
MRGQKLDDYRLNGELYMKQLITIGSVASIFTGFALFWGEAAMESTARAILIAGGLLSLAISNSSNPDSKTNNGSGK